jgi:uncharacterized membrane protein YhaH (DUF805 family)
MAFCSNCGSRLDEGARFCTDCGTKVEEPADAGVQPGQPFYGSPPGGYVSPGAYQQPGVTQAAGMGKPKNAWQYFCGAMKKYAVFAGRARRAEYWYYWFFSTLIYFLCKFIDNAAGLYYPYYLYDFIPINIPLSILTTLAGLIFLLPSWGAMVRRYHDTDRRAWFFFIPVYGIIILFFEGTTGPNRFGPDPKQTR